MSEASRICLVTKLRLSGKLSSASITSKRSVDRIDTS